MNIKTALITSDFWQTDKLPYDFITVGAKHVRFWRYEPDEPGGLTHKDPMYRER